MLESNQKSEISELIQQAIGTMGIDSSVACEDGVNGAVFNISSPDSNLLIGQRGANLQALQILVGSVAQKRYLGIERFSLDVDDYRKKREWYLRETAKKAVEHVKKSGRPTKLEPMSAYERRVVHAYLSQDNSVDTESIGEEPNRRIVIRLKSKDDIF